jgi:hypothetical protein
MHEDFETPQFVVVNLVGNMQLAEELAKDPLVVLYHKRSSL